MGEDRNVDMSEGKNSGQCVCDWSGVYDEQAFEEAMIAYEDELSGYCAELLDKSKLTDTPGHDLLVKLYELHDDEHEEDYNNHKTVGWDFAYIAFGLSYFAKPSPVSIEFMHA